MYTMFYEDVLHILKKWCPMIRKLLVVMHFEGKVMLISGQRINAVFEYMHRNWESMFHVRTFYSTQVLVLFKCKT